MNKNELSYIHQKIRYATLSGQQVNSKGYREDKKRRRIIAIVATVKALSDMHWHRTRIVREICTDNNVNLDGVLQDIAAAQSDNGRWISLLHDDIKDPPEGSKSDELKMYGEAKRYIGPNREFFLQCMNCNKSKLDANYSFCPVCGVKFKWRNNGES